MFDPVIFIPQALYVEGQAMFKDRPGAEFGGQCIAGGLERLFQAAASFVDAPMSRRPLSIRIFLMSAAWGI